MTDQGWPLGSILILHKNGKRTIEAIQGPVSLAEQSEFEWVQKRLTELLAKLLKKEGVTLIKEGNHK